MIKKENGITLVALVITIIVLLILAGIGFSLALGQNGILTQAKSSVTKYSKAEADEKTEMIVAEWKINESKGNKKDLYSFLEEIKEKEEDITELSKINQNVYSLTIGNVEVNLSSQGEIISDTSSIPIITLSATNITLDDFVQIGAAHLYVLTATDTSEEGLLEWHMDSPDTTNLFFDQIIGNEARLEYLDYIKYGDITITVTNTTTGATATCVLDTSMGYNGKQ